MRYNVYTNGRKFDYAENSWVQSYVILSYFRQIALSALTIINARGESGYPEGGMRF